jgi:hypothetical protein
MKLVSFLLSFSLDNWLSTISTALVFVAAIVVLGSLFRLICGKNAPLTRSVSAVLSIGIVYLSAILLFMFIPPVREPMNRLPFLTVTDQRFFLWDILHLSEETLYPAILRLAILSFLVNTLEAFLPQGKKFFTWYLYRVTTALSALALYLLLCLAIDRFAPEILGEWAKTIITGFWTTILIIGLLKLLLSVVLTVINPIIGGLYAFFFAHPFGRQLSKSILTTVLSGAIIAMMNHRGIAQFAFNDFSLASYGPACVLVILALYLFGKLL